MNQEMKAWHMLDQERLEGKSTKEKVEEDTSKEKRKVGQEEKVLELAGIGLSDQELL